MEGRKYIAYFVFKDGSIVPFESNDENDIGKLQNVLTTKLSEYLIQVYPLPIGDRCIIIIIAMKPRFSELSLLTGIAKLYR